jgi:CheY-like chemotaxis protein
MPYKLLLADDSVTIQRVIELTFADEDVKVTAVGDGQQAIDHIVSDRPDIVLADVGMPKQDGYEVAAFIKGDPALEHIPVLLLTGAFEPVDEERARAVRCDGVLAKPFEPQLLIGRVKELLKGVAPAAVPAAADVHEVPEADAGGLGGVPDADGIDVDEDATVRMVRPPIALPDGDTALEVETLDMRPEPPAGGEANTLDDYFDRLDAAFAHLTGGQPGREAAQPRSAADPWTAAVRAMPAWPKSVPPHESDTSQVDELDPDRRPPVVFGPGPESGASSSPSDDLDAIASIGSIGSIGSARPAAVPPVATVQVADAFAALLDAEREHGPDVVHEGRPDAVATVLLPGTAVTAAFVDDVARRVIERLGEPVFRDVVREVVSTISARLVREEIERIKSSIP